MATLDRSQLINNGALFPFSAWSNNARPHRRGARLGAVLAGLGDVIPSDAGSSILSPETVTAMNSEAAYLVNLYRTTTGQQPLPAQQSAPSVNVGIDPNTRKFLAIAALAGLFLFLRARR